MAEGLSERTLSKVECRLHRGQACARILCCRCLLMNMLVSGKLRIWRSKSQPHICGYLLGRLKLV